MFLPPYPLPLASAASEQRGCTVTYQTTRIFPGVYNVEIR